MTNVKNYKMRLLISDTAPFNFDSFVQLNRDFLNS